MKKLILILTSSILIIHCTAIDKNKTEELQKITIETKEKGNESSEVKSRIEQKSEQHSINENMNFSIFPEPGKITDFTFDFDGKLIKGMTSGTINFSNNKTESKIKTVTKTYTIEKKIHYWYKIYQTKIIYRIKTKTKIITIDYPWYFWAVLVSLIVILWELLKRYLPINFLRLISNDK